MRSPSARSTASIRTRALPTAAAFLATLAALGCSDPRRSPDPRSPATTDASGAPPEDGVPVDEPAPPVGNEASGTALLGISHSLPIVQVVAAVDGSAAVSIDTAGGVRLWPVPALATERAPEPITLRKQSIREASLARNSSGSWLVALTDTAGGVAVLEVAPSRQLTEKFAIPPHQAPLTTLVLADARRVAVLHRDRSIVLTDVRGSERTRLEKRRFRPTHLVATDDGTRLVAVTVEGSAPKEELALQRMRISGAGDKLALDGPPLTFAAAGTLGLGHGALSPNGETFAYAALDQATSFWQVYAVDFASGTPRAVGELVPLTGNVTLAFAGEATVILSERLRGAAFSLDLSGTTEPRALPSPTGLDRLQVPAAVGGARRFVGLGTWIAVHDLSTAPSRFLGYDRLRARQIDRAADNSSLWVDEANGVFLAAPGAVPRELARLQLGSYLEVRFTGAGEILTLDGAGTLSLLSPRTGGLLDRVELGGAPTNIAINRTGSLIAIHRTAGNLWVFDLEAQRFKGPYVVSDRSQQSAFVSGSDGAQLLTYDPASATERRYPMAAVRKGIGAKDAQAAEQVLDQTVRHQPTAYDAVGRRYRVEAISAFALTLDDDAGGGAVIPLDVQGQHHLRPRDDGELIAVVDSSGTLQMISRAEQRVIWSYSLHSMAYDVGWSTDQSMLLVAGDFGAAVFDANTGALRQRDCALRFRDGPTAPRAGTAVAPVISVCER